MVKITYRLWGIASFSDCAAFAESSKSECSSLLPQVLQDPQPCDCGQSYIEVGKINK